MPTTSINSGAELQRAVEVLTKNWTLAIPTALASLIIAVLSVFVLGSVIGTAALGGAVGGHIGLGVAGLAGTAIYGTLFAIVAFVVQIVAQAVVMHAAEDAWNGAPVNLQGALGAITGRIGPLAIAVILCALIMLIPFALTFVLIGFPLMLIVGYFLMFVVPAVVLGGEAPVDAIKSSYQITRTNIGPSIVALVGIVVAVLILAIVNAILAHIPILNLLGPFVVGGFAGAFSALVMARFYDLLRGTVSVSAPPPIAQ